MKNTLQRLDFEGNCFYLKRDYGNYNSIERVDIHNKVLTIPVTDLFQSKMMPFLSFRKVDHPSMVEKIVFLQDSIQIEADTANFPRLTQLEVAPKNLHYTTDGRSLFSDRGKTLLRYMCLGNASPYAVPKTVQIISPLAFWNAKMEQITFPNRKISVAENAFNNSTWFEAQAGVVNVGKTVFAVNGLVERVDLTEGRTLHEYAFLRVAPSTILCDEVPNIRCDIGSRTEINELHFPRHFIFTSKLVLSSVKSLHRFISLESISFQEEHPLYTARDGILYSKDGKTLLYCPPCKELKDFVVPEGVTRIAAYAFYKQCSLESIHFPDTVRWIGTGAFSHCKELLEVYLPEGLTSLPECCIEHEDGVFECCSQLTHVSFGKALRSIGAYAFSECPLQDVQLPEGIQRLGICSLDFCRGSIRLPSSLLYLESRALEQIQDVYVQEGTGKGLVFAVGPKAMIHVQSASGDFEFPSAYNLSGHGLIQFCEGWDGESTDLDSLVSCFTYFKDVSEKARFALYLLSAFPERVETRPLREYLRHVATKNASNYITDNDEKAFLALLNLGLIPDKALTSLLDLTNRLGRPSIAAYLMDYKNAQGKSTRSAFQL